MRKGWSYDMNMTTEQKQIAIAEFEGWKECKYVEGVNCVFGIPPKTWKGNYIFGLHEAWAPPYLTSREAICGAVAKLDDWRKKVFAYTLLSNLESWPEKPSFLEGEPLCCEEWTAAEAIKIALATPSQMADALLLTLGHQI